MIYTYATPHSSKLGGGGKGVRGGGRERGEENLYIFKGEKNKEKRTSIDHLCSGGIEHMQE